MAPKVTPQVLKGMRDLLPPRMILRDFVISTLVEVFQLYGFEPLETPAIEYAETLEGKFGEEADKLLYMFEDRGGRRVGLRYDLTVPLARVAAMYPELVKPFKRYQISPVWRAEKPQRGRYREFTQCDVDTIGTANMMADAEVITVAYTALRRLGFSRFCLEINNRKALSALASVSGVPDELVGSIYRSIDKLEKIGVDAVRAELWRAGVPAEAVDRLLALVQTPLDRADGLDELRERLATSPSGQEGVDELKQLAGYLDESGVPTENWRIVLSMVRGLEYYTGPIFEGVVDEPRIGSICGGGRYDGLIGMFGSKPIPAVGISVGLERIIDVLEELQLAPPTLRLTVTEALVTVFGPETRGESLRLGQELRAAGIRTEVFLDGERLPNQLRYANRKGIPFVLLLGSDEIARGIVTLRDMATGEQVVCPRDAVASALQARLGGGTG
ncbi:MAG: histidine--tRNA ligase [Chloroflexi bacterium]|nr:histidine--tRNA ligase [Chloroflexota bacterium]